MSRNNEKGGFESPCERMRAGAEQLLVFFDGRGSRQAARKEKKKAAAERQRPTGERAKKSEGSKKLLHQITHQGHERDDSGRG